jgi:ribulose-5-phosphate 4-epimerase/fuculose-1-phosphate aldolase
MNATALNAATALREQITEQEWNTRVDLAAAYRLFALFGWDDLIFTHLSAKVPGTEHFLINPYGMTFDEITASSLVKIDGQGNKVIDSPYPVNPAGFTIHSCVHASRHDANCVMHAHAVNGVAVSAQKEGLLPISQQAYIVLASISYHDYEGIALMEDEKPRLRQDLGDKTFLMLRNHGLLTVGSSVAEAFLSMYLFETACMIQVRAQAGGAELTRIPQKILDMAPQQCSQAMLGAGGALAWPAMLRKLDRANPGYRA